MANYDAKFVLDTSDVLEGVKNIERLKQEVYKLKQANQAGIIGSGGLQVGLNQLSKTYKQAPSAVNKFASSINNATKAHSRNGVMMQQAGYQMGDFLVQIQSGTNAFVAFGQQATQMAGTLTLLGGKMVLLGSALGVGIPLVTALGAAWMRTAGVGKTLEESIKNLETNISDLNNITKTYTLEGLVELEKKYGDVNTQVLTLVESQKFLIQTELNKSIQDTIDKLEGLSSSRWYDYGISEAASAMLRLRSTFDITANDAEVLYNAFQKLNTVEKGSMAQADALATIGGHLKTILSTTDDVTQAQLDALDAVVRTEAAIREMNEAAPKATWMNAAQKGVNDLYNKIVASIHAVLRLKSEAASESLGGTRPKGRGIDSLPGFLDRQQANNPLAGTRPPSSRPMDFATGTTSGGGSGGSSKTQEDYLGKLIEEAEQKRKLIGLSEDQRYREELLFKLQERDVDLNDKRIEGYLKLEETTRKLIEAEEERTRMLETVEGHFEDMLTSMVTGAASIEDAFKTMLSNILLEVYKKSIAKPAAEGFSSIIGKIFGQANGGAWNNGIQMYANGGVVGSPTMFGHSGGLGVMGEAGPEAIMPLKRGRDGKLGVSGGGNTSVTQVFNISGNGDEYIMKKIQAAAPAIKAATKREIIDDRRRGGAMKEVFR